MSDNEEKTGGDVVFVRTPHSNERWDAYRQDDGGRTYLGCVLDGNRQGLGFIASAADALDDETWLEIRSAWRAAQSGVS